MRTRLKGTSEKTEIAWPKHSSIGKVFLVNDSLKSLFFLAQEHQGLFSFHAESSGVSSVDCLSGCIYERFYERFSESLFCRAPFIDPRDSRDDQSERKATCLYECLFGSRIHPGGAPFIGTPQGIICQGSTQDSRRGARR